MTFILQKASNLFFSSFQENGLLPGSSDIIVVKWETGELRSSPFIFCFGHKYTPREKLIIKVFINNSLVPSLSNHLSINRYGYLSPQYPSNEFLHHLSLKKGRNKICFQISDIKGRDICKISAQIYLYQENDKILVSDMDGTLTKSDILGLYHNYYGKGYLHQDYHTLITSAYKNGYHIVWLTMRSIGLYDFSKQYIKNHTKVHGPLLTQPEEFLPALKKQIMHQTSNIKTNMLLKIKQLFPQNKNPFVGGLGNRDNDAIAYRAAGIPTQGIFIIDKQSNIHHLGNPQNRLTYSKMYKQVDSYFPKISNKIEEKSKLRESGKIFKRTASTLTFRNSSFFFG